MGQQSGGYFSMPVLVENGWRENDCKWFFKSVPQGEDGHTKIDAEETRIAFGLFVLVFGWLCYKHVHTLREGFGPR